MLQQKLVGEKVDNPTTEDTLSLLHRTKVAKDLIELWIYSGRIVCRDSYSASVGCAEEITRIGM